MPAPFAFVTVLLWWVFGLPFGCLWSGPWSGLGQAQDIGVFDLSNGRGVILNEYLPWWNGLSAGDGTARWGITLQEETSSVGWIEYLP